MCQNQLRFEMDAAKRPPRRDSKGRPLTLSDYSLRVKLKREPRATPLTPAQHARSLRAAKIANTYTSRRKRWCTVLGRFSTKVPLTKSKQKFDAMIQNAINKIVDEGVDEEVLNFMLDAARNDKLHHRFRKACYEFVWEAKHGKPRQQVDTTQTHQETQVIALLSEQRDAFDAINRKHTPVDALPPGRNQRAGSARLPEGHHARRAVGHDDPQEPGDEPGVAD